MISYFTRKAVKLAVTAFAKSQGWTDEEAKSIGRLAGIKAGVGMAVITGDIPGAIASAAEEALQI